MQLMTWHKFQNIFIIISATIIILIMLGYSIVWLYIGSTYRKNDQYYVTLPDKRVVVCYDIKHSFFHLFPSYIDCEDGNQYDTSQTLSVISMHHETK